MKEITEENVLSVINSLEKYDVALCEIDRSLVDLGIDSIGFVQIIVLLEEEFACEIPDSKLLMTEMGTIRKIVEVLQSLEREENEKD